MVYITIIDPGTSELGGVLFPAPYDKFEEAFEKFQTELREEVKEELSSFKGELLQEIRQLATGESFDPVTFRYELLHAIEQKFQEFKEELAVALESTQIPSYPHVVDEPCFCQVNSRPIYDRIACQIQTWV